jgi:hypothetical protein
MRPVMFQWSANGMPVAGSILFSGSFTGSIVPPPTTATSGIWTYASPPNVTAIRVAVHLSSPFAADRGT